MPHLPAPWRALRRLPLVGLRALTLGSALLAGCAAPRSPQASARVALQAVVDSATTAFHRGLRLNDSVTVLAFVADDVVMLPPGEQPVRGKEGFRAWYSAFLTQYRTSSLTLTEREVFVGDGWATELGAYEWDITPVAGGAPTVDRGHYMQLWRQLPDGQWRFAREIWNNSVPPSSSGIH